MEILEQVEKVRLSWNRWVSPEYGVEKSDLDWNILRQSWLSYFVEEIRQVPCLFAVASQKGLDLGMNVKSMWLSLYGEIHDPEHFLSALIELTQKRGKSRLQFGGEDFHFVSGIPKIERSQRLLNQVQLMQFQTGSVVDFSGRITSPAISEFISKYSPKAKEAGFYFKKVKTPNEYEKMDHYLLQEFPGRWRREFVYFRELREEASQLAWFFFYDQGGEILGFSRIGKKSNSYSGDQWSPGSLRLPYVENGIRTDTDSCLGPIGITKSFRGKGLGYLLLSLTLEELIRVNAELLCIDWTDAYNYYRPLGLSEVRKIQNAFINLG